MFSVIWVALAWIETYWGFVFEQNVLFLMASTYLKYSCHFIAKGMVYLNEMDQDGKNKRDVFLFKVFIEIFLFFFFDYNQDTN